MVLLNRRGYSSFVLCRSCGETVQCKNCAIAMTYHKREHRLICHYCGYMRPAPKTCPKCNSEYVQYLGTGVGEAGRHSALAVPAGANRAARSRHGTRSR